MAKAKAAAKKMTKSELINSIVEILGEGATRKQVSTLLDTLTQVAHTELKKNGLFVLPGFAKFVVVKKAAQPARKGINPFTKEPMTFAAKPASKNVKARAVKAIKEAVG